MTLWKWSTTAATNATADATINLREGQAASTLNDAVRGAMAAIAKWRDDLAGIIDTGGSATAYTITTNQGLTALTDGFTVAARLHATNGYAATLAVDGLTAKQICPAGTTNVRAGRLLIGSVQRFTYDSGDDVWRVHGLAADETPTGAVMMYTATSAPSGWVRCNGRTIGNASSSATERANADTADLYAHLWTNFADAQCPVSGGRGASAAADYAANKAIGLPDWRGRSPFGLDDMGNSAAGRLGTVITDETTNGATGGAETVTLLQSDLPNATLTVSGTTDNPGNHTHSVNNLGTSTYAIAGGGVSLYDTVSGDKTTTGSGAHTHTVSGTTSSINGNVTQTAFSNMPPAFLTTWIIKL